MRDFDTWMETTLVFDKEDRGYVCKWVDEPMRLKCGKCLRGVISKTMVDKFIDRIVILKKCRICGAKTES